MGTARKVVNPVAYTILYVLRTCAVAQVAQVIIGRVVIPVQHLQALGAWSNEGLHYESVHLEIAALLVDHECDGEVGSCATRRVWLEEMSGAPDWSSARVAAVHVSATNPDAPMIGDEVQVGILRYRYRTPLLGGHWSSCN
ncbi:hypothetical protein BKG59_04030 [Mycobacteroides chelonae]|nr:hypothetical protein BKG63_01920 [Mycobacteroides chelonae]OHT96793.1 hypothetical protein BKG72_11700 [Mycobacteroides chelonae]OLT93865.1 hypothetical protein BKG59_04030 [Mycobacteroides chelonae]